MQVQLGTDRGWINSTQLTWHDDCIYRIHPDQLEYQYGPISTALRRYAEHGGWSHSDIGRVAQALLREWAPYPPVLASDWPHFQMLALLLAEALADEGL